MTRVWVTGLAIVSVVLTALTAAAGDFSVNMNLSEYDLSAALSSSNLYAGLPPDTDAPGAPVEWRWTIPDGDLVNPGWVVLGEGGVSPDLGDPITWSDALLFWNSAAPGNRGLPADTVSLFSDVGNTGMLPFPGPFIADVLTGPNFGIPETGTENVNGAVYTPGPGLPGSFFGPATYNIISDDVPEPATSVLFLAGALPLGLWLRRRKR